MSKKRVTYYFLKGNNSTNETKFDQYGTKVSMFGTVNEVDEETVTKEKNILFTREPTTSILSGNVEYFDEIGILLLI